MGGGGVGTTDGKPASREQTTLRPLPRCWEAPGCCAHLLADDESVQQADAEQPALAEPLGNDTLTTRGSGVVSGVRTKARHLNNAPPAMERVVARRGCQRTS